MFKQAYGPQPIPALNFLRQGRRLTRQGIPPVPQHPVQSPLMPRIRASHQLSQDRTDLYPLHPAQTTSLHRLAPPPHPGRRHPGRMPPPPRPSPVPVDTANRLATAAGLAYPLRRRFLLRGRNGPDIPNAGPPRPAGRAPLQLLDTFLTKDHKAATSTRLRCNSWTRTCVRASACRATARSPRRMVSSLWPVISSAALRLPRRITTRQVRAISLGSVRKRCIGVPQVGPKERWQTQHPQRGRPPLVPWRSTRGAWQWGQGGCRRKVFGPSLGPPSSSSP